MNDSGEKDFFSKLQSLPAAVQDYVLDPKISSANTALIKKCDLSAGQEEEYLDLLDQVFFKEIKVGDFIEKINKFGLGDKTTKDFLTEILGNIFLPLEDYLGGGIADLIKNLGSSPADFGAQRVEIKRVSAETAATEILLESGIKVEDPNIAKRIQEIIELRLREVHDDLETAAALVRGPKIGGADLNEESVKKIIDSIKEKMLKVQIVAEKETEKPKDEKTEKPTSLPQPPRIVEPTAPISPVGPMGTIGPSSPIKETPPRDELGVSAPLRKPAPLKKKLDETGVPIKAEVYGAEEEREMGRIKKEMVKKIGGAVSSSLDETISKIIKESGAEKRGEEFILKFKNVISTRLRDIRDTAETRDLMIKHPRLGGLGLEEKEAEKILEITEKEFNVSNAAQKQQTLAETEKTKQATQTKRKEKILGQQQKEEQQLTEKWMRLTRKTSPVKESRPAVMIKPAKPSVSVDDIGSKSQISPKPVERGQLVGPVEELAKTTLTDFRKLAATPQDAARKIKEKLDLLAAEDISKKIDGLNAWKQNEVMKIYFEILRESITSGKPVSQVIKDREAGKLPTLSEDEFKVIVGLNRELKI